MLFLVGWLLTILDLVFSFLGSMGSIGVINFNDLNIYKVLPSILLFAINIVLPAISIGVIRSLFKNIIQNNQNNQNNSNSKGANNEEIKKILTVIINVGKTILIYIIIYPTVICLDCYTTFLGVGQSFILEKLSQTPKEHPIYIHFTTIIQENENSPETLGFIIGVSIILLTGHFILAGEFFRQIDN